MLGSVHLKLLKKADLIEVFTGNKLLGNFFLMSMFILHSRESKFYRCILDGTSDSLGSCHFRGVRATCLSHKGGSVPLSTLPKDTTCELAGLFPTTSLKCGAPSRKSQACIPYSKVFWDDVTKEINPRHTD